MAQKLRVVQVAAADDLIDVDPSHSDSRSVAKLSGDSDRLRKKLQRYLKRLPPLDSSCGLLNAYAE
eukprot:854680-Pyramimonas_sp.AAC.1